MASSPGCEKTSSLSQLEGVELFRCRPEVAELVCRYSYGRKRERGKRCSKQGIQIINRADTDGDVWTVMLSSMLGKVRRNRIDGGLVNVRVVPNVSGDAKAIAVYG
jgi:hypothetical protein